jgi:hypothetical protein
MTNYDTLTEAIADLRQRDYVLDYTPTADGANCPQVAETLRPTELDIHEVHRFEGDSSPDDSAVLYALQSRLNPANKGLLVAPYGVYVDEPTAAFIRQLRVPASLG